MAAASPAFKPIPALEVRQPSRSLRGRTISVPHVVAAVFVVLGGAALVGLSRTRSPVGSSTSAMPTFMSFAVGDALERVALQAEPVDGDVVAWLPAGTRVGIGGRVTTDRPWASGVAYWVSADVDGHAVRGFVPAGTITLQAGEPPELALEPGTAADAAVEAAPSLESMGGGRSAGTDHAVAATSTFGRARVDGTASEGNVAAQSLSEPVPAAPASATVSIPWLPPAVRSWSADIERAAQAHGIAPDLVAIVLLVESGGLPAARSHVGASGLMQVMPATARDIAAQRGIAGFDPSQLGEPAVAIDFGAWYLAQQLKAFGQRDDPDWARSVELAAAAYNGGPGTAQRYARGGGLPNETQHYVRWVGGMWRERGEATSPTYEAWLAAGGRVLVDRASAWLATSGPSS